MEEVDVLATARDFVQTYGDDATLEATLRLQELVEQGDRDGSDMWIRIIAAIGQLLREKPH